jgi:ParB family chromosome partitioning protein
MVDCNLEHREVILFSEKASSYRIKMEALSHKGIKDEKQSVEILMEQTGESRSQIFRLLRLTELIVALSDKLDMK